VLWALPECKSTLSLLNSTVRRSVAGAVVAEWVQNGTAQDSSLSICACAWPHCNKASTGDRLPLLLLQKLKSNREKKTYSIGSCGKQLALLRINSLVHICTNYIRTYMHDPPSKAMDDSYCTSTTARRPHPGGAIEANTFVSFMRGGARPCRHVAVVVVVEIRRSRRPTCQPPPMATHGFNTTLFIVIFLSVPTAPARPRIDDWSIQVRSRLLRWMDA
jgi:hypothetical protein